MLSHFSRVRLCDPMDCSPPGPSVRGILQARILEWAATPPPANLPTQGSNPGLYVYLPWQALSLPLAPLLYLMTHKNRLRWLEWGMSTNVCHRLKLPRMLPFPRWRRWHREVELCTHSHTLEGKKAYIYVYILAWECVCVCVCVCNRQWEFDRRIN